MATNLQLSVAVRNARLDAIETAIGIDAVLKIKSGPQPADCATADAGTVLATLTLPTDWANAAANGAKTLLGTWQDLSADNPGTAAHFRLYSSNGTTCGMQGTVGATGSSSDMELDNVVFAAGQAFTVTAFSLTDANA
jgi:hypothetical protein